MGPRTLLTFDVDGETTRPQRARWGGDSRLTKPKPQQGTLIRSVGPRANALHKNAFAAAFREVFATETTIDVIQHVSSTCVRPPRQEEQRTDSPSSTAAPMGSSWSRLWSTTACRPRT